MPLSLQIDPDVWAVTVTPPADDTAPFLAALRPHAHLACPQCSAPVPIPSRPGFPVADLPYGDHPVLIRYAPSALWCTCGFGTSLTVRGICRGTRGIGWTEALGRYVARHTWDTADELRLRTGLPNSRIQALRCPPSQQPDAPAAVNVLGIDELYLDRRRFAVVTDISARRLLRFVPVASTMDGLSDRIRVDAVLRELPAPRTVTLDMNPAVLQTVRHVWPGARIVIDKRHALRTADRTFTGLIRFILNRRLDRAPDASRPFFGEAAYHGHRLRHLVTKRSASCTPVDLAQWALLRREEPRLWEAYLFREHFYDLFTFQEDARQFTKGLEGWQTAVRSWLNSFDRTLQHSPMTASLMMMTEFKDNLVNYVEDRATNAFTEFVNARLREHARRGRRYRPEALIALVNEELQTPAAQNRIAPVTVAWRAWQADAAEVVPPTTLQLAAGAEGPVADPAGAEPQLVTSLPCSETFLAVKNTTSAVVQTKRGRRVAVHAEWPPEVQAWLTAGPTRTRARLETRLASGAPPEDRPVWLQALRTPDQPLPAGLEQHVLLQYLRTQPNFGLGEHAADLIAHLTHPERLPVIARPYVTALAHAAIRSQANPEAGESIRRVFRRYDHLRDPDRPKDPDLVLGELDRLRQRLNGLESYVRVHARLLRITEADLPVLLADAEACWAIAASSFEGERGNVAALEDFSTTIRSLHEHYED